MNCRYYDGTGLSTDSTFVYMIESGSQYTPRIFGHQKGRQVNRTYLGVTCQCEECLANQPQLVVLRRHQLSGDLIQLLFPADPPTRHSRGESRGHLSGANQRACAVIMSLLVNISISLELAEAARADNRRIQQMQSTRLLIVSVPV